MMVSNTVQDAARLGKRTKRGERLLQSIDRYQSVLEKRSVVWSTLISGHPISSASAGIRGLNTPG